jgi:hypothetical protein
MNTYNFSEAESDLLAGANFFFKRRGAGLGKYFLDSLYSDIDSLLLSGVGSVQLMITGFSSSDRLNGLMHDSLSHRFNLDDGVFRGLRAGQDVIYVLEKGLSTAGCNRLR